MTGSVVFKGLTAGVYVDGTGTPFATASTMTANVDFSTRNIDFSTSEMTLANVNNGSRSTRPDLRIKRHVDVSIGFDGARKRERSPHRYGLGSASIHSPVALAKA